MSHTVNDFWRAVWHVKSPIVVMITKLKEKNKVRVRVFGAYFLNDMIFSGAT